MDEEKNLAGELNPVENHTDPGTGKTISRKKAAVLAFGSAVAGSLLNEFMKDPTVGEIQLDTDNDGVGDTVITDQDGDGVYQIEADTLEAPVSGGNDSKSGFNPATAPMASEDTVSDDMSFAEAFSSARSELGAGGVFAWHGEYYNTFYAEELNDNNQPVVEYATTDPHGLEELEDYDSGSIPQNEEPAGHENQDNQDNPGEQPVETPGMMAADLNADGVIDEVYIDVNQDGSADAVYTDLNQDGQLAEDEVVMIHDPENLATPAEPADPSMMAVDSNADGVDDALLLDADADQVADAVGIDDNNNQNIEDNEVIILNPDAMGGMEDSAPEVEYSGEIATDMPEDVSPDVLDQMDGDMAKLEDNFEDINNWS